MTTPTPVPVSNFDTRDIDPRHRFDAWQENIGVFFDLSMPDDAIQPANVRAGIDVCDLGDAVFGVTRSQTQRFTRDSNRVIHDNMDHILVQLFCKGGGVTSDNQHIVAGDMLIIDLDQPHDMINTDFENLTLVLPRELRPEISDMLAPLHGLKLSGDNPMIRFMATGFLNLWDSILDMTTHQAGSAMHGTLNLMQGCLGRESMMPDAVDTPTSIALAKVISRYVDANLSENLTPASLAQTFRMSRSQIYRIFAPHGGVANYLWDRRLQRSLQLLSQHRYSHKNISTIAFECGFNSESHFSRAFRAKFKITPSQVRADALAARSRYQANNSASSAYAAGLPNWVRQL
ncbi:MULTISPECIES: AraC family transcriptional regulator [unclassified Thalassospira]|uniref:AraC family transcriptional regulator n=1 Tax=unclassified Thalassospira TaxID=2648997 RepID=UPI0007A61717|nr:MULTISPECIES: AraC family transcriptional regulator [unclassified Thalassospira]KZD00969.1 AraC family transcriptional regulator [Thalassospira sp. MCCC 1A02898]ONH87413.1 AraC family transcriptional regulator [Thalassospira sp. MCCC 1A02803]